MVPTGGWSAAAIGVGCRPVSAAKLKEEKNSFDEHH
jgi:hypothetical protein